MNAAELALLADPKALLAYASSIVNLILNGEISTDVAVDTELAAHPAHPAPAEAPAQPAAPVEEDVKYTEIRKLGTYPVVSESDMTQADRDAGKTKVEKGFEDTTDNGINDSPIEKSARAAAMRFFKGDVAEVERYMQWFHDNKQYFIDGSKTPIVDGYGYGKDGFRDVLIEKGEAVMGERGGGAQDVRLNFDEPEQATRGTYVSSKGVQVNVDVYDTCANPQLSNIPEPEKPAPAPAPVEVPKKDEYAVYGADTDCDCADQVGIVTRDVPADTVWTDENGDGKHWEKKRADGSISSEKVTVLDTDEFKGVPDDVVKRDYQELVKRGFKGDFIVYNLTDSEGRNFVACVRVDADGDPKSWELFSADHTGDPAEKIPPGHLKGKETILNGKALMDDMAHEKRIG